MPHLKLEYSANIKEKVDSKKLFSLCHSVLVNTINADLFRCQSRLSSCDNFYIGEGSPHEAFIYLEVVLLEGRSLPQLQEMGKQLLEVLERFFAQSLIGLNAQIAVRAIELSSVHYFKAELRK